MEMEMECDQINHQRKQCESCKIEGCFECGDVFKSRIFEKTVCYRCILEDVPFKAMPPSEDKPEGSSSPLVKRRKLST